MDPLLVLFIVIALTFDFLNGFHDSANVVATAIASRAMKPTWALAIASLSNLAGPFLFGVAVATTIGNEVLEGRAVTVPVAMAALLAAILWNLLTWWFGIPSSSSHALIGGFVGAAVMGYGIEVIEAKGMEKVLIGLFISPLIGLVISWLFMRFTLQVGKAASPSINVFFKRAQWLTAIALGMSHGTNDAQKTMGILTLGLVAFGVIPSFEVPGWVIEACALAIALGTAFGGWRLIRTMGGKFYRVRPVHAFSSQVASAVVILGAALLGAPVSTTQVISSSIVGAGSAERIQKVRWGVAWQILIAWILTIPFSGLLGALLYALLSQVL
ncbi:MAG: inorganic phosphate transporter [Anaerolineales bacterium]|nr:inorganic phosphate transporter [Anaerolineales bacterium]MDW8161866.1 anion permease [Anaerolineales bacterium]